MKIILTTDMDELGLEGDIVDVAKGYARNYLIPKRFALEASDGNIKKMEMQRKKIDIKRAKAKESAEKIRDSLADMVITIPQKVGEEEKLYGSVTSMDVADQMEKMGVTIDKRKIALDKPIKNLGEFEVPIKLHPEVMGTIKVVVVPEE